MWLFVAARKNGAAFYIGPLIYGPHRRFQTAGFDTMHHGILFASRVRASP
jgi:hypothetical protein